MIRSALVFVLRVYQAILSPLMPAACRFEPTCSEFAVQAIQRHGPIKGMWLATGRVLRCRPGGGGGQDQVPE